MISGIFTDPTTGAIFVVSIVTAVLAIIAGILRFIAMRRIRRKHSIEDWLAYLAILVHIVYISMCLDFLVVIDGRDVLTLSRPDLTYIGKLNYAVPPLFTVNQLFSKMSILLFYNRTFGVEPIYARWIFLVGAITIAWFFAVFPLFLFRCHPVSKGWDLSQAGTCLSNAATVTAAESVNSGLDFVMAILAWLMIKPLNVSMSTKIKLFFLFAVAGLAGVVGIVKIVESYTLKTQITYLTGLWAIVQMACSVICSCALTYKPILPSKAFFKRILGSFTSLGSRLEHDTEAATRQPFQFGGKGPRMSGNPWPAPHSWLKIENGSKPEVHVWREGRSGPVIPEPGIEMNAIYRHRSFEVV